jgi:hypothetical protein
VLVSKQQVDARARYAALVRHRDPGDPAVAEAAAELSAARIDVYIAKLVDAAPPLSMEQRNRLALLLSSDDSHSAPEE